jgi:hypothetical protein
MELLARQKDYIASGDTGFLVFRPHVTFAGQHDDRLFVQMTMGCSLGRRNVPDELGDDVGSDPLVHEHLEISGAHRDALTRVHWNDPLRVPAIEVRRHLRQPLDLTGRTGQDEHFECLTGVRC